ncbi:MAG: nuclear transport factor 2 family protein [Acidimicrobiales bacterium]
MTDVTAEIRAMEDRRYAAMIAADVAALDELLCDDLQYTHSNAVVDTKQSLCGLLSSGKLAYRRRPVIDTVRVFGDSAILTGSMELDVSVGGAERTVKGRFTDVWVRDGGRWRFAAWQSTPLPA